MPELNVKSLIWVAPSTETRPASYDALDLLFFSMPKRVSDSAISCFDNVSKLTEKSGLFNFSEGSIVA